MEVTVNTPITVSIQDPSPPPTAFGARVEFPVTRAIASYWRPASLIGLDWIVTLDPVIQSGDYNLVWMEPDGTPVHEIFVPLRVSAQAVFGDEDFPVVDPAAVRPSVDDVANLERTRTFTEVGNELETFTTETRPPDEETEQLIDQAMPLVLAELPSKFSTSYYDATKHCIALYVAVLIEGSYFREQEQFSSISTWRDLYDNAIKSLRGLIDQDLAQWRLLKRIEIPAKEWAATPHTVPVDYGP